MAMIKPGKKESKKLEVIAAVALIAITITAVAFISIYYIPFDKSSTSNKLVLTTSFGYISPEDAYELINTSTNLRIVEVSNCKCKWKSNCISLNSNYTINARDFFNTTYDLLIYSYNGNEESTVFCNDLLNHTYGKIYCLDGGTPAWIELGYPTYNCKD